MEKEGGFAPNQMRKSTADPLRSEFVGLAVIAVRQRGDARRSRDTGVARNCTGIAGSESRRGGQTDERRDKRGSLVGAFSVRLKQNAVAIA